MRRFLSDIAPDDAPIVYPVVRSAEHYAHLEDIVTRLGRVVFLDNTLVVVGLDNALTESQVRQKVQARIKLGKT